MSKKGQIRRNTVDCVDTVITVQYLTQTQRFNEAIETLCKAFDFSIEDANKTLDDTNKNVLHQEEIAVVLKTYDGAITEGGQPLSDGKGLLMQASKWGKMVRVEKVITGIPQAPIVDNNVSSTPQVTAIPQAPTVSVVPIAVNDDL